MPETVIPPIDLSGIAQSGLAKTEQELRQLINDARKENEADHSLTVGQALRKYKLALWWSMCLSLTLIMEGYDVVVIGSFYGQPQFIERFGVVEGGVLQIPAAWQSGLSNSSVVGQLLGLGVGGWAMDRFGRKPTLLAALALMICMIFVVFFAVSLPMLAVGEVLCGLPWGVFQTLSTTYASEVIPMVLRPYVTSFVCMCWGWGIFISSGVVRGTLELNSNWAWRLPFALQWIWPVPLFIIYLFAPESPWFLVRKGRYEEAKAALRRLRNQSISSDVEINRTLALLIHTINLEDQESAGASYVECFKGINLRRTEINMVVWAAQILCGNALIGFAVVFFQRAGLSATNSFNLNMVMNSMYIFGCIICWFLMSRFGRATLYMAGMAGMLVCLLVTGALGFHESESTSWAIGSILIVQTLINMTTIGPVCYTIVAETCSSRLRAKTIVLGRFVYNLTGIFSNSVTPRMLSTTEWAWGARSALFYAGTNVLCLIWCWFRLPETAGKTFAEIEALFAMRVPARKFRTTKVDSFKDAAEQVHLDDDKKPEIEHNEYA